MSARLVRPHDQDAEEDEVELARLIIDPARRRSRLGRALVTRLLVMARATGKASCLLRVAQGTSRRSACTGRPLQTPNRCGQTEGIHASGEK